MALLKSAGIAFIVLAVSVIYLASSGVAPESVNLRLELGIALATGAFIVFLYDGLRWLFGDSSNKDLKEETNDLRHAVEELSSEIQRLREQMDD